MHREQYESTPDESEDAQQSGHECMLDQLRRSEAMLCTILDSVPQSVFWKDCDGVYLGCNEAFAQTTGLRCPQDVVGKTDFDLPWRDEAENYRADDREVVQTGVAKRHIIQEVQIPDGRTMWVDASKVPLLDEHCNTCGVLVVYDDITDFVKAAEALREAETRYKALVESTPVGIYLQQQGILQYANPSLARMAGYTPEEAIGKPLIEFIAPECKEEIIGRLGTIYESSHFTTTLVRRDGQRRYVEIDDRSIYISGKHTAIGSVVDITDRLRSERALVASEANFRSIFENAPIGIYRSTVNGRLLNANPTAAKMFGYGSPDEMISAAADIGSVLLANPERRDDIIGQVIESDKFLRFEDEYRRKDGSTFIANLYMRAVRQDGEVESLEGFVEDITGVKRAEEEKRAFYRETISSVTQGKLLMVSADDVQPYMDRAEMRLPVATPEEAATARHELEEYCADKGLSGDTLPLYITGLGEAITNATKHAPSGTAFAGSDAGRVWAGVTDNGPGISTLTLPRATLLRGYSTKVSMGMGYSIMLEVSDQVLLSTGASGTTVVLLKDLTGGEPVLSLDDLADTW